MSGAPEGIRTPDPRLRRPLLYPAELQAQTVRPRKQALTGLSADKIEFYHIWRMLSTMISDFFWQKPFFRETESFGIRFDTKMMNMTKKIFFAILFSYFLHCFVPSVRYSIFAFSKRRSADSDLSFPNIGAALRRAAPIFSFGGKAPCRSNPPLSAAAFLPNVHSPITPKPPAA